MRSKEPKWLHKHEDEVGRAKMTSQTPVWARVLDITFFGLSLSLWSRLFITGLQEPLVEGSMSLEYVGLRLCWSDMDMEL